MQERHTVESSKACVCNEVWDRENRTQPAFKNKK